MPLTIGQLSRSFNIFLELNKIERGVKERAREHYVDSMPYRFKFLA